MTSTPVTSPACYSGAGAVVPARTLPAMFAEAAARTPDAIAVAEADACLSYRALESAAAGLARALAAHGAGPEDRVAVLMRRSPDLVTALLAVLKSGAAYLPLDPDYPADRITYTLGDARPALLLTTGDLPLPELDIALRTVALDDTATSTG